MNLFIEIVNVKTVSRRSFTETIEPGLTEVKYFIHGIILFVISISGLFSERYLLVSFSGTIICICCKFQVPFRIRYMK